MTETAATLALGRADPGRLARFLTDVGEAGRDPRGGWSRLPFSPEERAAHEVFARWAGDLGLTVSTDAIGNTYAELAGREAGPVFLVGSHLDSVPQGGNFDGAAGCAAALEIARLVADAGGLTRSLRLVVFAAEEGARFGVPCIGSRIATGAFRAAVLGDFVDEDDRSVPECAVDVGLNAARADEAAWPDGFGAAFLELHVEQGIVLESRGTPLGIVDAVAGSTRVQLTFGGNADHSATPMSLRHDALVAASEFVVEVERQASGHPTTVATVGRLEARPGSLTSVPGLVELSLDVRDIDSERQRALTEALLDKARRIADARGLELSAMLVSDQSPIVLHKPVRERLAVAATSLGVPFCVMRSGATHDAAHVARRIPTGMVFVPSRRGLSHVPDEWSSVEDIARAANVMAATLVALDVDAGARLA